VLAIWPLQARLQESHAALAADHAGHRAARAKHTLAGSSPQARGRTCGASVWKVLRSHAPELFEVATCSFRVDHFCVAICRCVHRSQRGYGATAARLTPDQKVGSSNLSGLIAFPKACASLLWRAPLAPLEGLMWWPVGPRHAAPTNRLPTIALSRGSAHSRDRGLTHSQMVTRGRWLGSGTNDGRRLRGKAPACVYFARSGWGHRSHLAKGTWCSGITSASHAEGPGFKSQCVHSIPVAGLDKGQLVRCIWRREGDDDEEGVWIGGWKRRGGGGEDPPC
jgi:hypothetical protein